MKPLIRKSWYTLTEAADYLTRNTEGGPVTVSDVLQFGAEGQITISLKVTRDGTKKAMAGALAPVSVLTEQDWMPPESPGVFFVLNAESKITMMGVENPEQHPVYMGLWDIDPAMSGTQLLNQLWHDSKNGSIENIDSFNGENLKGHDGLPVDIRLTDSEYNVAYRLRTDAIPEGSYLVVKQSELSKLLSEPASTNDTESQKAPSQLEALPDDFRTLYEVMGAGELPHLDLLITAWRHFWKGRRPSDGKDYPINAEVAEWVRNRMDNPEQGNSKAKAIASIIRPTWAPAGRQPNRNQ